MARHYRIAVTFDFNTQDDIMSAKTTVEHEVFKLPIIKDNIVGLDIIDKDRW